MKKIRIFTSFNFAYGPRACLLARSLRRFEADIELIALVVDEITSNDAKAANKMLLGFFDRVVLASSLGIPNFQQWIFKHNVVEACTAVKPRFLENLLSESSGSVIYMDPDTCCFSPYINQLMSTSTQSILLTPHQLKPNESEQAIRDNELGSTKFGIFNLGFAAVRSTSEGQAFASWWRKSCEMACFEEVAEGIFTDQKWCDLVPALFADYKVIRDPGMNVASWNLSQRKISFRHDGVPSIDGHTLKFFHFTKIGSVGNAMIARYAESNVEAFELLRWYSKELHDIAADFPRVNWAYGSFDDGAEISASQRQLFRSRRDLMGEFKNPFKSGIGSFQAWHQAEESSRA